MSQTKIWACPNGCEIKTVLVCGGDLGKIGKPNIYFHMQLDGTYTHLHADGYGSVPDECHKHADGGCCTEPQCPECLSYCKQEEVKRKTYKSEGQLKFLESLCGKGLTLYHMLEESWPEIHSFFPLTENVSKLSLSIMSALDTAGFSIEQIEVAPYKAKNPDESHHEIRFLFDLTLFEDEALRRCTTLLDELTKTRLDA